MSYNANLEKICLLGNIKHYTKTTRTLTLTAENGTIEVTPYSHHVVRVGIHFPTAQNYHSYAVVQNEGRLSDFALEDKNNSVLLKGKYFDIDINKQHAALDFKTKEGKSILQDEEGLYSSRLGSEMTVFKKIHADEKFLGLGEKTGDFNRRGKFYTNKNSDTFAYGSYQDPLYSTIPFFIGVHSGLMYGIFVDNTYTTNFDFGVSTDRYFSFSAENGSLYYYFIYGNTLAEIVEQYTWLTGRMTMPPLWSIGFHQSRYSYYPEYRVDELVDGFSNRDIPLDAVHFDIHYMDAYKAFTFDKKKFKQPKQLVEKLRKKGIHIVPILDPGVKIEKGYTPYDNGVKKDVFVRYTDGKPYQGGVWPGICHFPDFTNPKVRTWWANLCAFYTQLGIDAFWNDMNEPAVWGQMFPSHTQFDYEGLGATFKKARNIYGLLMTRASFEGLQKKDANQRYFLLTRAAYSGIQRYAAKWTGDNVASDEHMLLSARMINSLGISGVAFSGSDVGGFVANVDGQLYAKWIALGCFTPFFRAHKMINSNDSEPWCFGEEIEQISKNFIRLRYRLTPYLYTHFFHASAKGTPINKPMSYLQPHDEWTYSNEFQNQFLHGDSFLVCPVDSKTAHFNIHFPQGAWFDFYTDQRFEGDTSVLWKSNMESLPVFVKEGSIIPMQKPLPNLHNGLDKTLELHIYLNEKSELNHAQGQLYIDDGKTLAYQQQKKYAHLRFLYEKNSATLTIEKLHVGMPIKIDQLKVYLHGTTPTQLKVVDGVRTQKLKLKKTTYTVLDAIPNFDPFVNEAKGLKVVPVSETIVSVKW